jgi:NADH dehydrogenase
MARLVSDRPRVVIAGAGFGGLWAARTIAPFDVDVLLIDQNNYHTFLPLLYQVAAAELEPEEIAYPVRSILRGLPNVEFVLTKVKGVEPEAKLVKTENRTISFDYLVLSTGSVPEFFRIPGADKYALPLKTLEDGIGIRSQILTCFEKAVHEVDRDLRAKMLTFTIVGGGPTGVEFAGALVELIHGALVKDFATLNFQEVHVVLVEALGNLLSGFPERLQGHAVKRLVKMGVDVRLSSPVAEITPDAVLLKDGTLIPSETVVWTAGVRGRLEAETVGLPTARNGQILVSPTLQVEAHPNIYIVGDLAQLEGDKNRLPMIAPVATQQGAHAGRNIIRQISGLSPRAFQYQDRGKMVTIGRNYGAAELFGWSFTGFPAWVIWLVVHLYSLIGFRNRVFVLIDWAWDYFFIERAIRLIIPRERTPS